MAFHLGQHLEANQPLLHLRPIPGFGGRKEHWSPDPKHCALCRPPANLDRYPKRTNLVRPSLLRTRVTEIGRMLKRHGRPNQMRFYPHLLDLGMLHRHIRTGLLISTLLRMVSLVGRITIWEAEAVPMDTLELDTVHAGIVPHQPEVGEVVLVIQGKEKPVHLLQVNGIVSVQRENHIIQRLPLGVRTG